MNRQLIVAGFHRSGTSLVGQLLQTAGLFLGYELVGPNRSNPHGHFEDAEILDLHKRLLGDAGASWQVDEPLRPPIDAAREAELVGLIERRDRDHALWGFKDPRVCLFLDEWKTRLPEAKVLIVYRHCSETSESLARRHSDAIFRKGGGDELDRRLFEEPDLALRMWLVYNEALIAFAREHPQDVLAVSLDALHAGFPLVEAVNRRWKLGLDERSGPAVLDTAGRRARGGRQPVADPALIEPALATWEALEEIAAQTQRAVGLAGEPRPSTQEDFYVPELSHELARSHDLKRREVQYLSELLEQRSERTRVLRHDLQVRFVELQSGRSDNEHLKQMLAHRERQLATKERQLAVAARDRRSLERELERAEQTIELLGRSVETPPARDGGIAVRLLGLPSGLREHLRLTETALRLRMWRQRSARRYRPQPGSPPPGARWRPGSPLRDAVRGPAEIEASPIAGQRLPSVAEYTLERLRDLEPPTILIPVYDAHDELVPCIESLIANTTLDSRLLVIDDASPDPRIAPLLAGYAAELPQLRVLTNEGNRGYVRTANRGISESTGDVVLLNSDTAVGPRWLENLRLAAHAGPRIATATAISNNAGAFSVPVTGRDNPLPAGRGRDELARLVTQLSTRSYPGSPTGSGFCMYIKRAALEDVGAFDAERYPRGYGEENDFCMRARKAGWTNVVDDATYVLHRRSASFRSDKRDLLAAGREVTDRLHPEYTELARSFVRSDAMERVRETIRAGFERLTDAPAPVKPRVLFVTHQAGGGTSFTNADLMDALADRYSCYLLVSDTRSLKLLSREGGRSVLLEEWPLHERQRPVDFSRPDYREIAFELLFRYRFELVHVRQLIGHSFDLPKLAADLGTPVVLSFHDFYLSCPTVHLIDDRGRHCGGECTPGYGRCLLPPELRLELPVLKHAWLGTWRAQVARMVESVDAFVTTSQTAKAVFERSYPSLADRRFDVIEHGRDLEQADCASEPVSGSIRILVPGNIGMHKGAELIERIAELDSDGHLELHFLGATIGRLAEVGVHHGRYERGEFNDRVREVAPALIGIFSIWPETYCHTLTEAWGAGVPVIASNIGTLKERVEAHGGGWLIDHEDPAHALEQILAIANDLSGYRRERARASLAGIRSTRAMADDYDRLYGDVLDARRPFRAAGGPSSRRVRAMAPA